MDTKENKRDNKVVAVVVTYNRKQLLLECVQAILKQSYPVHKLIIVDNASTDGTESYLNENKIFENEIVDYQKMSTNTGGSGGFYVGLDLARNYNADWVWIMDDDTIPYEDSLQCLIEGTIQIPDASFFASCVRGENGEPMNVPLINKNNAENGYPYWYKNLKYGMVSIATATFVSILINAEAIKKCGLPCKDYFIWGDDTEYTRRLVKNYGLAYLVGKSWVCHKRKNAKNVHIKNETDKNRIRNYYYHYRNRLVNYYLYDGRLMYLLYILRFECQAVASLFSKNHGFYKFYVIQKGVFGSFVHKSKFREYINNQLAASKRGIN